MSIVFMPVPDAKTGPIVDPQGESLRTMIYCIGILTCFAKILRMEAEIKSVAYRWL